MIIDFLRSRLSFHWQNLSLEDEKGPFPFRGRAWFRREDGGAPTLRVEWCTPSRFAHAYFDVDASNAEFTVGAALPPIAVWVALEVPSRWISGTRKRRVEFSVHDWCAWWTLWMDPHSWSSKTPRWRVGNFHFLDAILGKEKYEHVEIRRESHSVSFHERTYVLRGILSEVTRSRPRWFTRSHRTVELIPDVPIPIPGKGENSWDCDEDAIWSRTSPASSFEEAIGGLVGDVLRTRRQRGGPEWMPSARAMQSVA